ncbi:MAG TPA: Gfo/Idh/MocA family oxidoreductase [Chthoniobacteraceae bacterium]|jgi:predicted dehydrogenase|nr:Gfo/Idh/MocA family oxidoreductase [Chthoniobacteraceae bacterium]
MNLTRRRFVQAAVAVGATGLRAENATPIRVGQIGTGHAHASGKIETLRNSRDFELVGVCEPEAKARAAAEKSKAYGGLPWLTEEQLLASPGLQAVAVETHVGDLLATAQRCVEAGKHIHLDKPAGESLPAFQRLLDAATQRKLIVQMGYMFRYNPAFQLCAKLVREGVLGEVFSIDAVMSKLQPASARGSLLPYRGGSMFELGCHVIDAAVRMLGRPAKVMPFKRADPAADSDFAVNQLAVLEYPKAIATIRSTLLEVDGGARRQFVLCGTKGTFEIYPLEPAKARLVLQAAAAGYEKGAQEIALPKAGGRYDGDFADFAAVLRGEHPFEYTPAHDLAVQETVLLASGLPIT